MFKVLTIGTGAALTPFVGVATGLIEQGNTPANNFLLVATLGVFVATSLAALNKMGSWFTAEEKLEQIREKKMTEWRDDTQDINKEIDSGAAPIDFVRRVIERRQSQRPDLYAGSRNDVSSEGGISKPKASL